MKNIGVVTEIKENKVKIRFIRESACGGNCSSCGGCSVKPVEIYVENTLDAKMYDKVEVETDTSKILFSAFVLYIFPLISLILTYLIADIYLKEAISAFIGVLCFLLSFLIVRKYGKNLNCETEMARIVKD